MPYRFLPDNLSYTLYTGVSWVNGVSFKPDGTKMYISANDKKIREYDLSIPWSIGSSSYLQLKDVSANIDELSGIYIKSDGLKIYLTDRGASVENVSEYDLGVAWDITSAVFLHALSTVSENDNPYGVTFKPDGTKMYLANYATQGVDEYLLGTPWDISSAAHTTYIDVTNAAGLCAEFKPDGTRMYASSVIPPFIEEYALSVAWSLSTATLLNTYFNVFPDAFDMKFSTDGSTLYLVKVAGDEIYEYGASISKETAVKSTYT